MKPIEKFETDLVGRVDKIRIGPKKCLMPLFETIVNSLQAIEDIKTTQTDYKGEIKVYLIREKEDDSQLSIDLGKENRQIHSFRIIDNGIGFNNKNYGDFKKSDTTSKKEKGGKGIGRFSWLKAFEKVRIYSKYIDDEGNTQVKKFLFSLPDGIYPFDSEDQKDLDKYPHGSIIELINFKPDYLKECPMETTVIVNKIIEHCLLYLKEKDCPEILIYDDEKTNLNNEFTNNYSVFDKINYKINDYDFEIYHLKLSRTIDSSHKIHFCADNREVMSSDLKTLITCLNRKIITCEEEFFYKGYVFSSYLNENVDESRNHFIFDDDCVNFETIKNQTKSEIYKYLEKYLKPIGEKTYSDVKKFINEEAPEFRPILKYKEEKIKNMPQGIIDSKNAKVELYKITQEADLELYEEGDKFKNRDFTKIEDYDQYKSELNTFVKKYNDFSVSKLTNYVLHRNIILKILDNYINKSDSEGKFIDEAIIHSIIFPPGNTSEDIDFNHQNLWLIDERMNYHCYLASDKALCSQKPLKGNKSRKETDLTIFYDNPHAYSEQQDSEISSIFILELKKSEDVTFSPGNKKTDPVSQVLNYIDEMRYSKAHTKDNKLIEGQVLIEKKIPFYAYIICKCKHPSFKRIADYHNLWDTPDFLGYFRYFDRINAYLEVISYTKFLKDAKRRNSILFNKLGLKE